MTKSHKANKTRGDMASRVAFYMDFYALLVFFNTACVFGVFENHAPAFERGFMPIKLRFTGADTPSD